MTRWFRLNSPLREALLDYGQGPLTFLPALVLLLVIRAYGVLGAWDSGQVLALSLGMTASILLCSGFVYAMSRRASICLGLGDRRSASRFLRGTMLIAGLWAMVVGPLLVLGSASLGLFTPEQRATFVLAFLGLSAIWILGSGLSLLRASGWLGVGLSIGLLTGLAVDRTVARISDLHLWAGTVVGFVLTIGVIAVALERVLGAAPDQRHRRVALPPVSYLIHEAAPYFAYGTLYAILPFLPHPLGWFGALAEGEGRISAVISLEAGLSLSLPPLILASGVAEHTLRQFWTEALAAQRGTFANNPDQFGAILHDFYERHLRRYLIVLGALSVATYVMFRLALATGLLTSWIGFNDLDMVERLFLVGLAGYWLLGWGLFNCMFPITLARPRRAMRSIGPAIALTVLTGVPLSLGVHFTYAAIALIIGSMAYVIASSRQTRHVLQSAHYYYYSAY